MIEEENEYVETKTELKEINLGLLADCKKQNVLMKEKKQVIARLRLFFGDCPDWGDSKTLAFDSFPCIIDIFQAEANGKKRQQFVFFSLIRISWSMLERGKRLHLDTIAWVIGFGCCYVAHMYQIISRISTWFFPIVRHSLEGLQVKGEDVNYLLKWAGSIFLSSRKLRKLQ